MNQPDKRIVGAVSIAEVIIDFDVYDRETVGEAGEFDPSGYRVAVMLVGAKPLIDISVRSTSLHSTILLGPKAMSHLEDWRLCL